MNVSDIKNELINTGLDPLLADRIASALYKILDRALSDAIQNHEKRLHKG